MECESANWRFITLYYDAAYGLLFICAGLSIGYFDAYEVTKPFAQEAELAEKLERLSALNALLNMDEKGNDGIDMDDEREAPNSEKEVADHPAKSIPLAEKTVGTE